jgi:hypothetical protein
LWRRPWLKLGCGAKERRRRRKRRRKKEPNNQGLNMYDTLSKTSNH